MAVANETFTTRRVDLRSRLSLIRAIVLVGFLAVMAWSWGTRGVPLERLQILLWIGAGLSIATLGSADGGPVRVVRDWLPLGLILLAYDASRGAADTLGMPVQIGSLVRAEKLFMFGSVPPVWVQEHLGPFSGPARWWEVPVALSYLSHFCASFFLLAILWARNRPRFREYRRRFLTLTGFGLLTYILLPAAPPWMASDQGLIGPVDRVGLRGMSALGLELAHGLVNYGHGLGNNVAALPSLHAGWSALLALYLGRLTPRWMWPVLAAYPILMGASLVIAGEHYVVDVLLGYVFAIATVLLWNRLERDGFSWSRLVSRGRSKMEPTLR